MEIVFLKKFSKDLDKIKQLKDRKAIADIIESVRAVENFEDLAGVKKLSGFDDAFRIRSGNYRVGVFVNDNVVEFARVAHRKDIYRVFP